MLVRIVVRDSASRDVGGRVQAAIDEVLADAGAVLPIEVKVVPAIEREPGHAAKVKLVVSEALDG